MTPHHTNPTKPRIGRQGDESQAFAPYNFVPLPDQVTQASANLGHSRYAAEGMSGWFDCELTTLSPTYIRGMLTSTEFAEFGDKKVDQLTLAQKEAASGFFSTSKKEGETNAMPSIPGSSLRGMLRSVVEVITFSRMRWVAKQPVFTFRAVAAQREDPLREPYSKVLGAFGANVRAGYLKQQRDNQGKETWYVEPATLPRELGLPEQGGYLKISERALPSGEFPGLARFDDFSRYTPGYFPVSLDAGTKQGAKGKYAAVTAIGKPERKYPYEGTLVCSGNMLETGSGSRRSPRKKHAVVLYRKKNAPLLKIADQAVQDYKMGLSTFATGLEAWGGEHGVLKSGAPVFYVEPGMGKEISYFGHSPNFRIPAIQPGSNHAATPLDHIPTHTIDPSNPDMVDNIFGWVKDEFSPADQHAGHVSFEDAHFLENQQDPRYSTESLIPHVLSGPKVTTFQHYLVQDRTLGADPDDKKSTAHYGTAPGKTQIRGSKFYWVKGRDPEIRASLKELGESIGAKNGPPAYKHESQLTRIRPLRAGVSFHFRIHFSNLQKEELGALCWALSLPGQRGKQYVYRLGMGKPLGMGAVKVTPRLVTIDRKQRYASLFDGKGQWQSAASAAEMDDYIKTFEAFLAEQGVINEKSLAGNARIKDLLTMLEWREGSAEWNKWTRYMEIEHEPGKINEYKERPVLPTPGGVVDLFNNKKPGQAAQAGSENRPAKATEPKQPLEIKPGMQLLATVDMVENEKTIYLKFDGHPENKIGLLNQAPGQPVLLKEGQKIRVEVLKVVDDGDEQLVECVQVTSHTPEGYQSGVVLDFGGPDAPYGHIQSDHDGKEVFVHQDQAVDLPLTAGMRVVYKPVKGKKGRTDAMDVRLAE
jgi:CRISPR-associated protein (TIGR03986 family)